MRAMILGAALAVCGCASAPPAAEEAQMSAPPARSMAEILATSPPSDWVALHPESTLYMELPAGRVVIALAPDFAPHHVANIKALAREGYYDGAAIVRLQENYVAQWARPEESPRDIQNAQATLPAEFDSPIARDVGIAALPDRDTYADYAGFARGFPVAGDRETGRVWLAHCYAMVGAGRDVSPDSGGGAELYAVIGHSPRHLDRNVTLVGRVVQGMSLLTSLPRGTGELGFYETAEERTPIAAVRVAADVPEAERTELEYMRADSVSFVELTESRRNRHDAWFARPAGAIEVCNVPIPVRAPVRARPG